MESERNKLSEEEHISLNNSKSSLQVQDFKPEMDEYDEISELNIKVIIRDI